MCVEEFDMVKRWKFVTVKKVIDVELFIVFAVIQADCLEGIMS